MSVILASKNGCVRHIPATWWGKCSYRQLSVTYETRKALCPLCGSELEDAEYLGSQLDSRFDWYHLKDCWMPLEEDGRVVWVVKGESG
jgi:hypothetical protein